MSEQRAATPFATDIWVMVCGLATTALTLGAVSWLARVDDDLRLMSWYVWFFVPVGAMIVGVCAGSGYGIASWRTGRRVGGGLLAAVLVAQVVGYGAAQWLEFRSLQLTYDNGEPVGFLEYYDAATRSMTLENEHSPDKSRPLGGVGYVFRLLELVAFAGGGLIAPLALKLKPYCADCGRYMKTRTLMWIPAAVAKRRVPKKDVEAQAAYQGEMEETLESAMAAAQRLSDAAQANDSSAIREAVLHHRKRAKETRKLLHRLKVELSHCPQCRGGRLRCLMLSGQGDKTKSVEVFKTPVGAAVVEGLSDC